MTDALMASSAPHQALATFGGDLSKLLPPLPPPPPPPTTMMADLPWTLEEELKVRGIVKRMRTSFFEAMSDTFPEDPLPLKSMEHMMSTGQSWDPVIVKQLLNSYHR